MNDLNMMILIYYFKKNNNRQIPRKGCTSVPSQLSYQSSVQEIELLVLLLQDMNEINNFWFYIYSEIEFSYFFFFF